MAKEREEAPKTQTYILRPNQEHHGFKDGERHTFVAGDEVELSDRQYKAFKDKFDSKKELQARARVANGGKVSREEALAALGVTEEEFSRIAPIEETAKKPNPHPSTGASEPTPPDVTPPPVGSTPDPVNAPPKDEDDDKDEDKKPATTQQKPAGATAGQAAKK